MRRQLLLLLLVIPPFLALLAATGVYFVATQALPGAGGQDIAYVTEQARLRECPSRNCAVTATYGAGRQVVIDRVVKGEEVNGSRDWVVIEYGNERRFIARGLVETPGFALTPVLEFGLTAVIAIAVALNMVVLRSKRLRDFARRSEDPFDLGLFSLVLAAGLSLGVVAFLLSRADRQSAAAFFSGAFANLGAGLVGAAIIFVLFQVLLGRRAVRGEEFTTEMSLIRSDIERLTISLASDDGAHRKPERLSRVAVPLSACASFLLLLYGARLHRRSRTN